MFLFSKKQAVIKNLLVPVYMGVKELFKILIEIWGSQGSEDVHVGLLACNTTWNCRRNIELASSAMKVR